METKISFTRGIDVRTMTHPDPRVIEQEIKDKERGKFWKKAHIATSNKLVRVMFAMLGDRADFNPPTAKIDYLEMLFSQRRRRRRQERKKEKVVNSL